MSEKPRQGRMKGTRNLQRAAVYTVAPRCPSCASTDREPYDKRHDVVVPQGGEAPDGKPYTHIVIRRTRCTHCGQALTHREYRNVVPPKK